MHYKIKFVLLLFVVPFYLFSEDRNYTRKFEVEGSLINWAWANTQDNLAILVSNDDNYEVQIIVTETMENSVHIQVPKSMDIRSMEWTADDTGIIFLVRKNKEYRDGVAFFDLKTLSFRNDYDYSYIQFRSMDQYWSLAYDPVSQCWATLSTGEGHPDITISRNKENILNTDVYPEWISLIGWQKGRFYFKSSIHLEMNKGNSGKYYIYNPDPDSEIESVEQFIYSVDPASGILKQEESLFIPDIRNTSKSEGLFYFQYKELEEMNKTEILIW